MSMNWISPTRCVPAGWRVLVRTFALCVCAVLSAQAALAIDPAVDNQWPTSQNNNAHRGSSPTSGTPPLILGAGIGFSGGASHQGPIIANNVIYSAGGDGWINATSMFDIGRQIWRKQLGNNGACLTTSPTVAGDTVYVPFDTTSGSGFTDGLYALDAADGSTLWVRAFGSGVDVLPTIPVVVNGSKVFAAASGNTLVALDTNDGSTEWTYQASAAVSGGPTVAKGRVYFVVQNDIVAVDEDTGEELWVTPFFSGFVPGVGHSAPMFANGVVYATSDQGIVEAISASSGVPVYEYGGLGDLSYSTPAYDHGLIFVAGSFGGEGLVIAHSARGSGRVLWTTRVTAEIESSVAVANGHVYVMARDGYLRSLDAATGDIVSEDQGFHANDSTNSPAIILGGHVFTMDGGGGLNWFSMTIDDADGDLDADETDCAPNNASIGNFNQEVCDGVDNNCRDGVDEGC